MDYKYIEQLLERYWTCETSLEEEQILRSFFSQKDVPAELTKYRDLFAYENEAKDMELGEKFDQKVLATIEATKTVKIHRLTWKQRIAPFCKAAAAVAVMITISNVLESTLTDNQDTATNNETHLSDTYVRSEKVKDLYNVEDKVKAELKVDSIKTYKKDAQTPHSKD